MKKLDSRAHWLFFVYYLSIIVVVLSPVILSPIIFDLPIIVLFGTLLVLIIGSAIWAYLVYNSYSYSFEEDHIEKDYGVINLKQDTLLYSRIQNVNLNRPLLYRLFGLSKLSIQTAGASGVKGGEYVLPGLSIDEAKKLQDRIIEKSKDSKGQGV